MSEAAQEAVLSKPRPAQRREWHLIGLLSLIMVLKGVLWSIAFPLWQGPDEDDHYAVIQFIAETGRLPDKADIYLPDEVTMSRALADVGRLPYAPEQRQAFSRTDLGPNEFAFEELNPSLRSSFELEGVGKLMHATPLYYVVAAGFYRLTGSGDLPERAHIQRLLAVIVGTPLVLVAYLIARILFPSNPAMRLTIPTLVAFHPMVTEITAVVSVDGLLILMYSLLTYLSLRVLRDGFTPGRGLVLGAVFAIGVLTKPTLNGYAPLLGLLVAYDFWRGPRRRSNVAIGAVVMGVAAALPIGWWMLRSWELSGDLFYFNPVVEGHRIIQNPYYDYGFWQHMLDYYHSVWGGVFVTWWAHFGWLDTALPPWTYHFLRALTFAAIGGLIYRLVRNRTQPLSDTKWREQYGVAPLVVWGFLGFTITLPFLLLQLYDLSFWREYGVGRGLQGRYMLGTVVPMVTFLVVGILCWLPVKWHGYVHAWLRIGMVMLNIISLLGYIMPRYYL